MSSHPKIVYDEAKLRDALRRLVDGVWRGGDRSTRASVDASIEPCFSIPANYDRDADLILAVAIDELIKLRAAVEAAQAMVTVCQYPCGDPSKCGNCAALASALAAT